MFIEIYKIVNWGDIDQLFTDVVIACVSFYFGQKGIQYEEVDSLIEEDKTLDNNNKL